MGEDSRLTRRQVVRATTAGMAALWLGGGLVFEGPTSAHADEGPPASSEPWDALAEIALQEVKAAGSTYGDIRVLHITKQDVVGRDRRIHRIVDVDDLGFGVRVLHGGAWGFAASGVLEPAEVRRVARLAVEIAKGSSALTNDPVKLAEEPVHTDVVKTAYEVDPFDVPLEKKAALLEAIMEALHADGRIKRSHATLWAQRDRKLFASTEGTHLRFDLLASNGWYQGTAALEGRFASRSFSTTYLRKGWELIEGIDLVGEAPRVAAEAIEKAQAPAVAPGAYDLVLDPAHLALTIHETCGHPTELDRALGYEANFAGTSFLTPDKLGHFRYGSKHVNLVADNTEPETLAATGYDDDGVEAQKWDIVREGMFVGYGTNREVAPKIGQKRSRGSNRADSWKSIPIVRIPNLGLEPGKNTLDDLIGDVKKGIYIEGRGSFSIDQRRYNFQFGGDAFWLIEDGKRKGMLRDVIYHGITPEFWGRCDGVAGPAFRQRRGFVNCGKGQPGQSGWMTHAAVPALFRGVDVITGETTKG